MTHKEAGSRGGSATLNKYGPDYLKTLGSKGGRPRLPTIEELEARHQTTAKKEEIIILKEGLPATLKGMKALWVSIQKQKEERRLITSAPGEAK